LSPLRILLVDDSQDFLEAAAGALGGDPRLEIVGRALSGPAAVEMTAALDPDLVLMDLSMPGMTGLQATQRIKANPHAPRVVILTLHDGPQFRSSAAAARADGFVTKSQFEEALLPLIENILRERQAGPVPSAS
jgi:two-component system, NarL family, nitrate/nitrite response regulator NarL